MSDRRFRPSHQAATGPTRTWFPILLAAVALNGCAASGVADTEALPPPGGDSGAPDHHVDAKSDVDHADAPGEAAPSDAQPDAPHPDATESCSASDEVCDGVDNDCDGEVDDEPTDEGEACDTGWTGVCAVGNTVCVSGELECEQVTASGPEQCNGLDDDCDGTVDDGQPGAGLPCDVPGQIPGTPCALGATACATGGAAECVQLTFPVTEVCDGVDNDCTGAADDADPAVMCAARPQAVMACESAVCVIGSCAQGWDNLNGNTDDGCETSIDGHGDDCVAAVDLGTLPDNGAIADASGTIAPGGDVDWFRFGAADSADDACDNFHARVELTTNPGSAYAIEVVRGACGAAASCAGQTLTTFDDFTNFRAAGPWGAEVRGECPCSTSATENANICSDNSAIYFVKVYRPDGAHAADLYGLRVSNGTPAPPL